MKQNTFATRNPCKSRWTAAINSAIQKIKTSSSIGTSRITTYSCHCVKKNVEILNCNFNQIITLIYYISLRFKNRPKCIYQLSFVPVILIIISNSVFFKFNEIIISVTTSQLCHSFLVHNHIWVKLSVFLLMQCSIDFLHQNCYIIPSKLFNYTIKVMSFCTNHCHSYFQQIRLDIGKRNYRCTNPNRFRHYGKLNCDNLL